MEGRTQFNYGTGGILKLRDINYMFSIVNSNLSEEAKAVKLYSFCNKHNLKNSATAYNLFQLPGVDRINELMKIYEDYEKKQLFNIFKGNYRCTLEEIALRINKINEIYSVINSDVSDYNKAAKLLSFFNNSEEFRRSYALFIKYGKDDERLDSARDALDNFDMLYNKFKEYEEKGITEFVKYVLNVQGYADNYDYAKFVVEYYVESPESYKTSKFLKKFGIDEDIFKFCISAIKELDVDLYQQYLEKKEKNNRIRCLRNAETIVDLANGIKFGILADGTQFDVFEFIKRVPFKRSSDFLSRLIDFMRVNNRQEMGTIMRYMRANRLYTPSAFVPLNIEGLYQTKTIINGVELTNEDNDTIIDYLRVNNLPVVNRTYILARDKYLNGEFTAEMVEKQKEQLELYKEPEAILIPSKK